MMGVGKSTIGRRLAGMLGVEFADMDERIEHETGLHVSEIFEKHGEAYFRGKEFEMAEQLLKEAPQVIASGGGAFAQEPIRNLFNAHAITIWLDTDLDTLVERATRRDIRPLLQQGDPRQILSALLEKRRASYELAHLTINSGNGEHMEVVGRIVQALQKHLRNSQDADATSDR